MKPSLSMKSDTNIKIPLAFIIYALVALVAAQIILFFNNDLLLGAQFRTPDIWMGTHFLLLGFAVMIAMGAMYQLVPVAFLTPIWSQKLGLVQFLLTAAGVTLFAVLIGFQPAKAIYGGVIAVMGIILFIFQMAITIMKQQNKGMMTYFVLSAITSFFLTIIAGFLLAWNIAFGAIETHLPILFSHMVLGVAGWFTLLIFGFSYKLVPMFSLSHGFSMKRAKIAFLAYVIGLIFLIASFWFRFVYLETLGWVLLFLGFGFFALDMKEILTKRLKRKLDKPFIFSLLAIANGLIIHFLALMIHLFGIETSALWGWLTFLYVMCWIVFSIMGYLYKIVPFLWWTHKYSSKIGKEKVPTLKDLIDEKLSVVLFISLIISVIGLVMGGLLQIGLVVVLFQGLLALTSLVYAASIIRVLFI